MSLFCPNKKCSTIHGAVEQKDGSWTCKKCGHVTKKHSHRWQRTSHSQKEISEICSVAGCGARRNREPTEQEGKWIRQVFKEMFHPKPENNIHRVWHAFAKRFLGTEKDAYAFKLSGYEFMTAVDKWAERFPDDVHIVGCDDAAFMSSSLVLIEHKTKHEWMGISVVVIPQNSDGPVQFFLYPGHAEGLLEVLLATKKKTKQLQREEKRYRAARRKTNPFA